HRGDESSEGLGGAVVAAVPSEVRGVALVASPSAAAAAGVAGRGAHYAFLAWVTAPLRLGAFSHSLRSGAISGRPLPTVASCTGRAGGMSFVGTSLSIAVSTGQLSGRLAVSSRALVIASPFGRRPARSSRASKSGVYSSGASFDAPSTALRRCAIVVSCRR